MKILLINHYAGSVHYGMEYRPYYLAREWVEQGAKVHIFAGSYSHLRRTNIEMDGGFKNEKIDGINYTWLKTPRYQGNGLGRAFSMFCFVQKLYGHGRSIASEIDPDVVIASSTYPLDIFPARHIARSHGARLVFEVHDLWPLSPMELGNMSRRHPFIMAMQFAEDYACRHADRIVSILPQADLHLRTRGMRQNKFYYVPNGIKTDLWNENEISGAGEHHRFLDNLKKNNIFLVGYAGGHGVSNALSDFVKAAGLLKQKNIAFVLIGAGPEKKELIRLAQRQRSDNVFFLEPVEKKTIAGLLSRFDALYIGWQRQPLYRFGISPNKLFDYMMAAKPVIHAIEAANDHVAESGCGISCEPENPRAIADAVLKLRAVPEEERKTMGLRGREYVLRNHDYRILAQKFLDAVQ